ncbi:hypothetical protein IMCC26256_111821 [Actinobacteria bacterium IMCC26256]|nr:hypothetical protein IMCC26256_111821 [Actinobacteria bacterium IMCC26256]
MTQTINDQSAPVSQRSVKAKLHSNTLTSTFNWADGGAGVRITDKTEIAALLADLAFGESGLYRHFASKQLGGGKRQKAELKTALDGACARVLAQVWAFPTTRTEVEAALAYELGQKSAPVYLATIEEVNGVITSYFERVIKSGESGRKAAGEATIRMIGKLPSLELLLKSKLDSREPGLASWHVTAMCRLDFKHAIRGNQQEADGLTGKSTRCNTCLGTGHSDDNCPDCRPGSQLGCDSCNWSGRMKCEPCNGKGRNAIRLVSGNGPDDNEDDEARSFLDKLAGPDDTATYATNAIEGRERIELMRPVYANAYNAFNEMRQNNPNREDIQIKVKVLIAVLAREALACEGPELEADAMFDRRNNAAGDNVRGAGGLSVELTEIVYDEIAIQFPHFDPTTPAGRRKATNYCNTYAQYTGRANPQGTTPENPEPEEAGVTNDV